MLGLAISSSTVDSKTGCGWGERGAAVLWELASHNPRADIPTKRGVCSRGVGEGDAKTRRSVEA